jgi:hypothetical protein
MFEKSQAYSPRKPLFGTESRLMDGGRIDADVGVAELKTAGKRHML